VQNPETVVQIPYRPRALQKVVGKAMRTHRFGVLVCHRRWGKSVCGVNVLQQGALMCERERPRFAYIGPTYRQAKATVWDYVKFYARPIPGVTFNESELRADYPNGGQLRIYGGDDPDSLRGLYFDGVVVDEYGLHQSDIFSTVLRPALSDREGWALFLGTPNGKNQFYSLIYGTKTWVGAKEDPAWFYASYKASETDVLPPEELAAARKDMTADEYAQEYECSFEASVKGAIYASELDAARQNGRVSTVPYDPVLPVDTDWDLGVGDSTAIWFSQSLRSGEVRLIDYYEASGEGLPHYAQVLTTKGYTYGTHWAPHDIAVRELGSGRSRLETAATLGIRFQICPNIPIEDGIHAARMLFPRCYFDATRCAPGLEALQHYRRDYNTRLNEFKATPVHDWASHGADAFRGLAVRHKLPKDAEEATAPYIPPSPWS
jgi:phage terminase large subunit